MTREETIKVLAILKAAYPNSYKNMSKEEANGTVSVWAMQFATYPPELVMIAINKLISSSPFPPAICEVKDKIGGMYWEVWGILNEDRANGRMLTDEQRAMYHRMMETIETIRNNPKAEPAITELMGGGNRALIGERT